MINRSRRRTQIEKSDVNNHPLFAAVGHFVHERDNALSEFQGCFNIGEQCCGRIRRCGNGPNFARKPWWMAETRNWPDPQRLSSRPRFFGLPARPRAEAEPRTGRIWSAAEPEATFGLVVVIFRFNTLLDHIPHSTQGHG